MRRVTSPESAKLATDGVRGGVQATEVLRDLGDNVATSTEAAPAWPEPEPSAFAPSFLPRDPLPKISSFFFPCAFSLAFSLASTAGSGKSSSSSSESESGTV